MSRCVSSARRRTRKIYAGGMLAMPLLMAQCQPACEPAPPPAPRLVEQRDLGTTYQGRPITAYRLGTPGGKVVLAIGSIHGDEQAGIEIVEYLRDTAPIAAGYDVWVIPTINPDGNAVNSEGNAAGVDLNRNWPPDWAPIDCALVPQNCSGPTALSEPETQAVAAFITEIQPRMTVWYHAVGPVVDRASQHGVNNPAVLATYAAEVGYPVYEVSCGTGGCTGNATQYGNYTVEGSSAFVVELGTKVAGGMGAQGVLNHIDGIWAAAAVA
jgi:protein MpaA